MNWAIIPVKHLVKAKQRLSSTLSSSERERLFRAMLEDVLTVLVSHPDLDQVWVVSADESVKEIAGQLGANFLSEQFLGSAGLNDTVSSAASYLENIGAQRLLVVHGDIPLINRADVSRLIKRGIELGERSLVIATDDAQEGSNCLFVTPPTAINFAYGHHSCDAHAKFAREACMNVEVIRSSLLACDVDDETDIVNLLMRSSVASLSCTVRYLNSSGMGDRIRQSNVRGISDAQ